LINVEAGCATSHALVVVRLNLSGVAGQLTHRQKTRLQAGRPTGLITQYDEDILHERIKTATTGKSDKDSFPAMAYYVCSEEAG
jgi:hypothetical protein